MVPSKMRKLRRQLMLSIREYMVPDSAPPEAKRSMIVGLLIYAARARIIKEHQYKRLRRLMDNFYEKAKKDPGRQAWDGQTK